MPDISQFLKTLPDGIMGKGRSPEVTMMKSLVHWQRAVLSLKKLWSIPIWLLLRTALRYPSKQMCVSVCEMIERQTSP